MSRFTFLCPRARADEAGAHDITDAMSMDDSGADNRVLYCRRCGQAVAMPDALRDTAANLDKPEETGIRYTGTPTVGSVSSS